MEKLYIVNNNNNKISGADCGSDHELLMTIQTEIEDSGENH